MRKARAGRGAQGATGFSSRFPAKPLDQPDGNTAAPKRLRRRADFLRAAKGMRFVARGLTLQAAPRPIPSATMEGSRTRPAQTGNPLDFPHCAAPPRFGFTVTKQSGGAVRRNRIRRRLKEALRLLDPLPARPGHDYVILARPEALAMPFLALQGELIRALGKIGARKNSPPIGQDNDREASAGDAATRPQNSIGRNPKG